MDFGFSGRQTEHVREAFTPEDRAMATISSFGAYNQSRIDDAFTKEDPYAGYPDLGQSYLSDPANWEAQVNEYDKELGRGGLSKAMETLNGGLFGDGVISRMREAYPDYYNETYGFNKVEQTKQQEQQKNLEDGRTQLGDFFDAAANLSNVGGIFGGLNDSANNPSNSGSGQSGSNSGTGNNGSNSSNSGGGFDSYGDYGGYSPGAGFNGI